MDQPVRKTADQSMDESREEVVELGTALDLTDNARGNAAEGNRGRT